VTDDEIAYCRADVRATVNALNGLKQEFDRHPIQLRPDRAYSPASIAKVYLEAMGILPPRDKFQMSDEELGIAMQAYYGGRAECRVRPSRGTGNPHRLHEPVPHGERLAGQLGRAHGEGRVVRRRHGRRAQAPGLGHAQRHIRARGFWKRLSFFALVEPNDDVLPVRAVYNGETQNIGINYLRSDQPIWFAAPTSWRRSSRPGERRRYCERFDWCHMGHSGD
jgi:hypothetical protein